MGPVKTRGRKAQLSTPLIGVKQTAAGVETEKIVVAVGVNCRSMEVFRDFEIGRGEIK